MPLKHRSQSIFRLIVAALCFAGCVHRTGTRLEFLSTDGFRYRAGSAVVGRESDTLRVAVVVVNDSRDQRLVIESSMCSPFNRIGAKVTSDKKAWDSDSWQPVKQPANRDSSGRPIIYGCTMQAMGLPPGTLRTFELLVPVKAVLGDSLPNGRYTVTARVRINATLVQGLDAGHVTLSSPPTGESASP